MRINIGQEVLIGGFTLGSNGIDALVSATTKTANSSMRQGSTQLNDMVRADFRGIKSRNQRSTSVQKVNCKAGKPLDYAPLTIISARAIGLMTMMDTGKKDHKVIAVATSDPEFNAYHEASQLPPHRLRVLRRFFLDYKQARKEDRGSRGNCFRRNGLIP
jgi:Inorganic pyrophosphatase